MLHTAFLNVQYRKYWPVVAHLSQYATWVLLQACGHYLCKLESDQISCKPTHHCLDLINYQFHALFHTIQDINIPVYMQPLNATIAFLFVIQVLSNLKFIPGFVNTVCLLWTSVSRFVASLPILYCCRKTSWISGFLK